MASTAVRAAMRDNAFFAIREAVEQAATRFGVPAPDLPSDRDSEMEQIAQLGALAAFIATLQPVTIEATAADAPAASKRRKVQAL